MTELDQVEVTRRVDEALDDFRRLAETCAAFGRAMVVAMRPVITAVEAFGRTMAAALVTPEELRRELGMAERELAGTLAASPPWRYPSLDARPIDFRPDWCWRCDAAPGVDPLGLCPNCRKEIA